MEQYLQFLIHFHDIHRNYFTFDFIEDKYRGYFHLPCDVSIILKERTKFYLTQIEIYFDKDLHFTKRSLSLSRARARECILHKYEPLLTAKKKTTIWQQIMERCTSDLVDIAVKTFA